MLRCSAVARLAAAWREEILGGYTNAQLCVDEEFSRPGVEALLEEFQKKLNTFAASRGSNAVPQPAYAFDWRPSFSDEF